MENENWAERKGRVGLSGMTAGIADLWPGNIRRRKFGEVSCTECAVQVVSEFPSICNHCGVTGIWSRTTLKILKKFLRIFGKATHYGKIFKILLRRFSSRHRSTCCVQISWNLVDVKSVKSCVAYRTKKTDSPDRAQNLPGPAPVRQKPFM